MKKRAYNFKDRAGMKFNRLTVIRLHGLNRHGQSMWLCQCECGRSVKVQGATLAAGRTKSCGCFSSDQARERQTTHGESRGDNRTSEYVCWLLMRNRCANPKAPFYYRYGGRGVRVCLRWNKYENFLFDMGRKPSKRHSIDRTDNNRNYCPSNCVWATDKQQGNNKSSNRIIKIGNLSVTMSQCSEMFKIPYARLNVRLSRGWPALIAIVSPKNSKLKSAKLKYSTAARELEKQYANQPPKKSPKSNLN